MIAIIALVVSAVSLTWQVVSFVLNGFRLRINLHAVLETFDGEYLSVNLTASGGEGQAGLEQFEREYWMELLRVEITNAGRIATSISETGILICCPLLESPWPPIRERSDAAIVSKKRTAIRRGEFLECYDGHMSLPVRLEPGESVNFVYDFWPLIETHRQERPADAGLYIRGVARPAGGRVGRSPWRRRWRLSESTESFRRMRLSPRQRAYRGFWRAHGCTQPPQARQAWLAGIGELEGGSDFVTVGNLMSRFTDSNELSAAIEMEREYRKPEFPSWRDVWKTLVHRIQNRSSE